MTEHVANPKRPKLSVPSQIETGLLDRLFSEQTFNKIKRYFHTTRAQKGGISLQRDFWMMVALTTLFTLQCAVGFDSSIERAALIKPLVSEGEFWRLVSGTLLHGSVLHLLMNLVACFFFGLSLQGEVSQHLLFPTFILSALGGSLMSWALSVNPSVGASGGIYGFLGFLLAAAVLRQDELPKDQWKNLIWGLFIGVVQGARFGKIMTIDYSAHLGGFLAGLAFGIFVIQTNRSSSLPLKSTPSLKLLDWVSIGVFGLSAIGTAARILL